MNASYRATPVYHSTNTQQRCVFRKQPMKSQPSATAVYTLVYDCQKDNRVPPATKNHKVLLVSTIRPQNETIINTLSLSDEACHSDN